jgi:hypothetical protein
MEPALWATAARQAAARPSLQAKSDKATEGSAFQLAAAREVTKPVNRETVAVDRKRKPATPKPEKP